MKKLILVLALGMSTLIESKAQIITNPITIDLPSTRVSGTKLKLRASLNELNYSQELKFVRLTWLVKYYADSLGYYGRQLNLPGITPYVKRIVADNTVKVDSLSGDILEVDSLGNYPEGSIPMGQYDWFFNVGENMEINVHDMILEFGLKAKDWDKP